MTTHPHFREADALYGYIPTEWVCALFISLFSLFGLIHIIQALRYRTWWMLPTAVVAALGEVIGWSGRLWSSENVGFLTLFLMQVTTTIISPTPLLAANFVILGKLIRLVGSEYSRLGPNMYTIIFVCVDVIALIVQAVGGSSASIAVENDKSTAKGSHIMMGGIVFQMASILIYTILALEFLIRVVLHQPIQSKNNNLKTTNYTSSTPNSTVEEVPADEKKFAFTDTERNQKEEISWTKVKLLVFGLGSSTLWIFIRSVYRTIELSEGFGGSIEHNQHLFNSLDGAMIVLALSTWNFLHPGWLLPNGSGW